MKNRFYSSVAILALFLFSSMAVFSMDRGACDPTQSLEQEFVGLGNTTSQDPFNLLILNSSASPVTLNFSTWHIFAHNESFNEIGLHCVAEPSEEGYTVLTLPAGKKLMLMHCTEKTEISFYNGPASLISLQKISANELREKFGKIPQVIELTLEEGWIYNSIARKSPLNAEELYKNTMYSIKLLPPLSTKFAFSPAHSGWKEESLGRFKGYVTGEESYKKNGGIVSLYHFSPESNNNNAANNKKPVALFLVHGTWAAHSNELAFEHSFFQSVLRFAEQYAIAKGAPIDVVTFGWDSGNWTETREEAGVILSSLINEHYQDHEILTVAHSHGANVINCASHSLHNPIEFIIHLAVPVREHTDSGLFKPEHFKALIHCYSTSDCIVPFGSIDLKNLNAEGSMHKFEQQPNKSVVNIRTLIDGSEPDHSAIKYVMHYMFEILKRVDQSYTIHTDLDMNVELAIKTNNPITLCIRNPLVQGHFIGTPAEKVMLLNKENAYNAEQCAAFENRYGRSIQQKDSLWYRMLLGVINQVGHIHLGKKQNDN